MRCPCPSGVPRKAETPLRDDVACDLGRSTLDRVGRRAKEVVVRVSVAEGITIGSAPRISAGLDQGIRAHHVQRKGRDIHVQARGRDLRDRSFRPWAAFAAEVAVPDIEEPKDFGELTRS